MPQSLHGSYQYPSMSTKPQDRTYHRVNQKKSWSEARDHCRNFYTDLTSFRNPEEQKRTSKLFSRGAPLWIGLYNNKSSTAGWKWINGDSFNNDDWKHAEPDNLGSTCVAVTNALWLNNDCNQTYQFTCYKGKIGKSQQKSWTEDGDYCRNQHSDFVSSRNPEKHRFTSQIGALTLFSAVNFSPDLATDRQYHRIEQRKNWTEAQDYCRTHYTSLTSIRSWEEHRLTSQLFVGDEPLWLGLYNNKVSTTGWKWISGDEFNYTQWKDKEPNDYLDSVICVAVRNGGWWLDKQWVSLPDRIIHGKRCSLN
uniref:C-type lectin domain-containing protein n=1 Tax=Callorhinchus milii TaxID=7868 RepID=A0A4W3GH16_CALMI